jgi:hypothetical protein
VTPKGVLFEKVVVEVRGIEPLVRPVLETADYAIHPHINS